MTLLSDGPEATEQIGRRLGAACVGGELIGLVGDLGAGKTCFARGIAAGLDIDPGSVTSPSFTLVAEHRGRVPLFHVDLYRLDTSSIDALWLREYLFGNGVAVVEWFDRLAFPVADEQLVVSFGFTSETDRVLSVTATGPRHEILARSLG
jgi:tRNA threonylcarbamoyladenosine biosynthesis protein TsaE